MQQISNLANSALQNKQPNTEKTSRHQGNRVMVNLWERMTHLYAHKFTTTYGTQAIVNGEQTDVAKTWASGLQCLTGEQLADGLRACVQSADPWPPSLPEFVGMCKKQGQNGFGINYVPLVYRDNEKPIRDRSQLLSSDQRDFERESFGKKVHALANSLRKKNSTEIKPVKKKHISNPDSHDYFFMNMLMRLKAKVPNIVQRINELKPGSFENV